MNEMMGCIRGAGTPEQAIESINTQILNLSMFNTRIVSIEVEPGEWGGSGAILCWIAYTVKEQ